MGKYLTLPFPGKPNLSPCCCAALVYIISLDAYCCRKCGKEHEVISVEKDHVLYDGGPPKERAK